MSRLSETQTTLCVQPSTDQFAQEATIAPRSPTIIHRTLPRRSIALFPSDKLWAYPDEPDDSDNEAARWPQVGNYERRPGAPSMPLAPPRASYPYPYSSSLSRPAMSSYPYTPAGPQSLPYLRGNPDRFQRPSMNSQWMTTRPPPAPFPTGNLSLPVHSYYAPPVYIVDPDAQTSEQAEVVYSTPPDPTTRQASFFNCI